MSLDPVAITGMNLCNALGRNRAEVKAALRSGQSGLGPCPLELPFETVSGSVPGRLPELPTELLPWTTRMSQLAQLLVEGLQKEIETMCSRYPGDRIGVFLGTTTAGATSTEHAYRQYLQKGELPSDYDLWRHHTYGASLHVMRELTGARGPGWVMSTACTASAKPFATAQRMIQAGMIDAAIVGGIDTLCSMTLRGFYSLDALSNERCRPFSAQRKGLNIGEGGALLTLERRGEAIAWLEAVGESSDAYHITAPHPQGAGAVVAMQRALDLAGCSALDIDYINAHGTGTPLNDRAEATAIHQLFSDRVPVVSTKGFTGHTLGAAGATEACLTIFSLQEGWIPASLGAEPIDEAMSIQVPVALETRKLRRAISNSFAFGGNNTSVLLRSA